MDNLSEKLISCVKNHPILYDISHGDNRNVKKKDEIWDEIGVELNETGDELKKKWKNLRDCYAKYIRSERSNGTARYYKSWPWAKQMEVFKPFLKFAHTPIKVVKDFYESSESTSQDTQAQQDRCEPQTQNNCLRQTVPSKKRKYEESPPSRRSENSVDNIIKYLQEERTLFAGHSVNLSATEHIFLGFAKTIETFSARRQAEVKLRIANIVLEEELLQRDEEEHALQSFL